jgi:AraC family transcriptional regulator of adaptative response/methylated-DNA-[protein]-cysteine methyltransferase
MKQIRTGKAIIDTQLNTCYESNNAFKDALTKIMGAPPTNCSQHHRVLKASWLDTPLGSMLAIADENSLFLLEFVDQKGLERNIERLRHRTKSAIIPGSTLPIISIEKELNAYFEGNLTEFATPVHLQGSPFQKLVWQELLEIPYGETRSYSKQAESIGRPSAFRAVANANGANLLAIILPCHRIINQDGNLGGYGGGIIRKKWLIDHERRTI